MDGLGTDRGLTHAPQEPVEPIELPSNPRCRAVTRARYAAFVT